MAGSRVIVALIGIAAAARLAGAAESARPEDARGIAFFESRIRPILVKHCYECHSQGAGATEGSLSLDSRESVRTGGDRGPAVVPGDPDASWLLTAVSHSDPDLQMPPKRPPLPAAVIADLRDWIAMGAPDPRNRKEATVGTGIDIDAGRSFWAYQPPRDVPPAAAGDASWPISPIDGYILAELEKHDLAPSPDAEPRVLLRRVWFDLVGLPPAPQDCERFLKAVEAAGLDAALAREVDDLLASPHFGERWGRHWLDVARFGESSGKEANISFPYAWRYRDYVIDCVNDDVPYDRFLVEQIAGDLLPYEGDRERARLLIATGFLALGPKNLEAMSEEQFQVDIVDEQIDTVTRAVLASSVACARCHDHKLDPFAMTDYYALAGIFSSTKTYFGTYVSPANRVGGDPLPLPRGAGAPVLHASIPAEKAAQLRDQLAALRKEEKEKMEAVYKLIAAGKDPGDTFTLRDALRIFWSAGGIEGQLEKVDDDGQALPLAMGVLDRDVIRDAPLLARGEIARPGDPVPRGVPQVLDFAGAPVFPTGQSGRLELAQWLTHPEHPLTGRVMVNRVWKHLLGDGLVASMDNFGATGGVPSHPALLDHLALRFVRNGWSVKRMVRDIVLTRTYRQSSTFREDAFQRDPDNRLLWRSSKRRLEAEAIRDAMLAVSGELDPARPEGSLVGTVIGDRPISLIGLDKRLPADLDGSRHRSAYLPVIRNRLPDVLDLFDFAEPAMVVGERETTNVPLQALYLMNSPFVHARSAALADRLSQEPGDDARIDRAFRLCFSRPPDADELARSRDFLTQTTEPAEGQDHRRETLISFCQALLSTAEFRNLD